ncbi:4899_t:CDS:2, partial [Dentiscutata erythropus]
GLGHIKDMLKQEIAHLCTKIHFLDLAFCSSITNSIICLIVQSCQNLEYLNLSGCGNISDVVICDIIYYCQKLKYLDISCCNISDLATKKIASSCINLKFLNIQLCEGISENAVKKLNSNIKVKESNGSQKMWIKAFIRWVGDKIKCFERN